MALTLSLQPQPLSFTFLPGMRVYLVGIRGVGMTALASILQQMGCLVRGADVDQESFVTDDLLRQAQISVESFASAQIRESGGEWPTAVVYSGAHQGSHHPLVAMASQQGITTMSLAQAVGCLSRQKKTIAVAGVGGKSTTTALLSWILRQAGLDPAFAIGAGGVRNLQTSGYWSSGSKYFVVEADEYVADPTADPVPRFLYLQPQHAIITALVHDHPDFYLSLQDTIAAFTALGKLVPPSGQIVVNGDDAPLVAAFTQALPNHPLLTVGEQEHNTVQILDVQKDTGSTFVLASRLWGAQKLQLPLPGYHMIADAAYAATMAAQLGVSWADIKTALASFQSIARRLEYRGTTERGAVCYDDYAHHPREITAILNTMRDWFPQQKIVMAFQPHTYSRTKALLTDFAQVLRRPDLEQVYLLPIFASAREEADPSISSTILAEAIQQDNVRVLNSIADLAAAFAECGSGTICLTLGAGDIYQAYDQLRFI